MKFNKSFVLALFLGCATQVQQSQALHLVSNRHTCTLNSVQHLSAIDVADPAEKSKHLVDDPPCGDVASANSAKCKTSTLKGGGSITVKIEKTQNPMYTGKDAPLTDNEGVPLAMKGQDNKDCGCKKDEACKNPYKRDMNNLTKSKAKLEECSSCQRQSSCGCE